MKAKKVLSGVVIAALVAGGGYLAYNSLNESSVPAPIAGNGRGTTTFAQATSSFVRGNTYYISPTGNDLSNGSQSSPWKTLAKAVSTVKTARDVIHVNAGTYSETQALNLSVGVSIEGAGADSSIIKSNVSGDWSTFLNLESAGATDGKQFIYGVTLDGQYVSESNKKTWVGIWNTFRSNVVVSDCRIIGFYDRAVIFNGNGRNESTIPVDPKIYATGNMVINNTFTNTARNTTGYIAGQVNIGGQKGMEINGNLMVQDQRVSGKNGELIKYWGSGYNVGCKIINNTLKKANFTSNSYNGSNGDWNFAIELFNNSGLEVGSNEIQGSIDVNYNRKGGYNYSLWIHDNVSDHSPVNTNEEQGIILEFETDGAIIENNKFYNQAMGVTFNVRTPSNNGGYNNPKPVGGYSATTNVIIRNNLFANLYSTPTSSAGIQFLTEGDTKDAYVRNLQIYNNTFVTKSGDAANSGIDLSHFTAAAASSDSITIRNNIFIGFAGQYLEGGSSKMLNTVSKDNCLWNNGNSNNPSWTGSLTNTGNLKVDPKLDANYTVNSSSPLYGMNIGWSPVSTPPCSITYGAWTTCDSGFQTRTYTVSPAGCGVPPADSIRRSCGSQPNQPPVANGGADQTITLPINTVTLNGSGTDPDGTIASYQWKLGTNIVGNTASLVLSNLVVGDYDYTLTVTDNLGAMSTPDPVHVKVNPSNPPPPVNDTIRASVILYGSNLTRKNVSYFVKRPDGFFYDGNTKRDIYLYKALDGKWFYLGYTDRKWYQLF